MKTDYKFERIKVDDHLIDFGMYQNDDKVYCVVPMNEPYNQFSCDGYSTDSMEDARKNAIDDIRHLYELIEGKIPIQLAYKEFLKTSVEPIKLSNSNSINQRFQASQNFVYYKTKEEQLKREREYEIEYSISTNKLLVPRTIEIRFYSF
jgi:hypothetical protein